MIRILLKITQKAMNSFFIKSLPDVCLSRIQELLKDLFFKCKYVFCISGLIALVEVSALWMLLVISAILHYYIIIITFINFVLVVVLGIVTITITFPAAIITILSMLLLFLSKLLLQYESRLYISLLFSLSLPPLLLLFYSYSELP